LISSVLVIVAIMAGAGILATLILRQIEKPIRSIEATAGAHIRGDTTARATEAGPKEFISVATQFNRMLDARDQAIADLKISDSSLREKNDIISTMIDNMTQGLVMFDAATRIVVCNRRYLQMYRLSPDVVKPGLTLLELIKHRSETGSFNGDPHELCRQMRKVIAKGRTAQVVETNHGHMIQLLIQPMADGGWVATHEDVTDKRQAELERDRAKTFLNLIIENTPSPIFVKDADSGRYILVNRAFEEFCGISRAEMIGKTARHIFANEEANLITSREEIFLQTHQVISDELTICTPRNGLRSVTSKRLAVRGSDGATQFVIGVIEDHTDRKNIEAQLRQAQKMEAIGNLTGGVAHDFNNLLTVMIGNLDMLLEENAGKPQMTQTVDTILEAALRGAELIKQMLAFSRLQPLQPKDVDVNALADKTMKLLTRTLGEAIRIDLRKSLDECRILVDAAQLEAALVNIAINARDAMPTGGILAVATEKVFFTPENAARRPGLAAGEHIIVKIADTGTGMSSEVMSHIFEPFYTTKETGEGTGLGLSMVYGFVKQSGGYISVTSSPGAGTTFELCFPAAAATAAAGVSAANHAGGRLPAASEVVLVVDDQASVRATAVANLKSLGYQVYEADCGKAALAMLTTGVRIDLLFTDIVMPGITGLELAKISCAERPGLKVLYTSGYSGALHDDRSEGSINGALLVKPYRKRELAKAVADVLAAA
jgi:PAS domain S-box-containing protein